MRRNIVALVFVLSLAGVFGLSCGGGPSKSVLGAGQGALVVFVRDTPLCDVQSLQISITGATLTPQGSGVIGGATVPVLSSGQSARLDFAALRDFSAILSSTSIQAGTYSQLNLTLANPQLTFIDFTQSPPAPVAVTTNLTTTTVAIPLNPALTISSSTTAGLTLDFNLLQSIETTSAGVITGTIDPQFSSIMNPTSNANTLGELENLHGLVQSVSATNPNFVLQSAGVGAPTFVINVNSSTTFDGVTGLSSLLPETFVEANVLVDTSGNLVAEKVEAEAIENPNSNQAAFLGPIVSVTTTSGNVTRFVMFIREEDPDVGTLLPLGQMMVVNVPPSIPIKAEVTGSNFDSLSFDASNLGVGQEIAAHGTFQVGGTPPNLNANAIFLRLQSVEGNFSSQLAVGTDGKTGGFTLAPCSSVFRGGTITVVTNAQTSFVNTTDLNSLSPAPTLQVRGLLFFEPTLTSAGTVTLTSPSNVFMAEEVHQLP